MSLDLRPHVSTFLRTWLMCRGSAADMELALGRTPPSSSLANAILMVKAAVDPAVLSAATAPAFASMQSAILESLAGQSALDWMVAEGAVPLPYASGSQAIVATQILAGRDVIEGAVKPVSPLALAVEDMQRTKAAVLVIVSDEVLKTARGGEVVQGLLRSAITRASNAALATLLSGQSNAFPVTASGSAATNVLQDLGAAAVGINAGPGSRLALLVSPSTLVELALMPSATGPVFLDLKTDGGDINGVRVFAADTLSGEAVLFDGARVAVADNGLELSISRHASVAATDDGAGATSFSLWQKNCVGLRSERAFGVALSQDEDLPAVAVVTGGWT